MTVILSLTDFEPRIDMLILNSFESDWNDNTECQRLLLILNALNKTEVTSLSVSLLILNDFEQD